MFSFDEHQGMGENQKEKLGDLSTMSVTSRHTLAPPITSFNQSLEPNNLIGADLDSS